MSNTFTYEGQEFGYRQTETQNIVWLIKHEDKAYSMPRSFTVEEIADEIALDLETGNLAL